MSESHGGKLINKPSLVESHGVRFLIMDAPSDSILPAYVEMLKKKHVRVVVRACEPTYNTEILEQAGIRVVGAAFSDGEAPPPATIDIWLRVLKETFPHIYGALPNDSPEQGKGGADKDKTTIAIHCIAGLGRAPVLVAIGFIEAGMAPHEAIALVRGKRRGAFNSKQLKFLTQNYSPKLGAPPASCCNIM